MTEHKSLIEALAAFQAEAPTIAKTRKADTGKYVYTYAGLADVMEAITPLLTRHGLSLTGSARHVQNGHYEVVAVLAHVSGEQREGALPIEGGTPQQLGSAITYARRYLLGIMTGVVTDDDDDGALASAQKAQRRERRAATMPPPTETQVDTGEVITPAQLTKLRLAMKDAGIDTDEARYEWLSRGCRRVITSSKQLTKTEATRAIDALTKAGGDK